MAFLVGNCTIINSGRCILNVVRLTADEIRTNCILSPIIPTTLGQSYGGGFYTGVIDIGGGVCYYLIVSPNATGCAICQWKTTLTSTTGTASLVNGYTNTYGPLNNASHPAGNWTATRTINGFSDWYLPGRNELFIQWQNGGSMPAGEGYYTLDFDPYLSSTEHTVTQACGLRFSNGCTNLISKTSSTRLRAIRRVPIV